MPPSAGDVMLALLSSEKAALLFARRVAAARVLLEGREPSLPGYIALAGQELQSLLARHHLAAADDAAVLVLHQVLLLETTRCVLRGAVEYLSLGTNGLHSYTFNRDFSQVAAGETTPGASACSCRASSGRAYRTSVSSVTISMFSQQYSNYFLGYAIHRICISSGGKFNQ